MAITLLLFRVFRTTIHKSLRKLRRFLVVHVQADSALGVGKMMERQNEPSGGVQEYHFARHRFAERGPLSWREAKG